MKDRDVKDSNHSRSNSSPKHQDILSSVAVNSPDASVQKQNAIIQTSPYIATQRKKLESSFGITQKKENKTGMPDNVKSKMEESFNTDFSSVTVHSNSSKAPQVGALAYTQGSDVHFAPGQFSPDSSSGQQLLGHELAHVVQQREGRVQPTTEVAGLPVNDNKDLENEADVLGRKASG